jgi:carbamoyl-phosphate synthase large subunit
MGAGGNAGLNFVKSIKKKNKEVKIFGVDVDEYNLASSNSDVKILLPEFSEEEKAVFIKNMVEKNNINLIHAQPDKEVLFLIKFRDFLGKEKIFPHLKEKWELFSNKLRCQSIWQEKLNISFYCYSLQEVIQDPSKFELLKKSSGKVWFRAISGAGSKAALPMTKLEEAINWANYWINNKDMQMKDFMLAEFLPGKEYAVQTFWLDGKLIHSQARERVKYFFANIMPSGQSSTPSVAKIIRDERIYHFSEKAILSLDEKPNGIYCIDVKEKPDGSLMPTEINYGRFFTTSDFFAELGVNTPALYLKSVTEQKICQKDIKINSIDKEYYWLRGLDKEPIKYLYNV